MAEKIKKARCPYCGGRLDRADYPRKPRGGNIALALEKIERRISFCCCKEGCRKRTTPPSVIFLGRKVYLGLCVIFASLKEVNTDITSSIFTKTGIALRTINRWKNWWHDDFIKHKFFISEQGQFMPPVNKEEIPDAIFNRFKKPTFSEKLLSMLKWLSPITTTSQINQTPILLAKH